jgi:hypothetical protein
MGMGLAEYLITLMAIFTVALGTMWIVTSVIGRAIDNMDASPNARLDAQDAVRGVRRPQPPGGQA